ncbi:DnaJ domain-containing protein [Fulvivirgaceae bacterium PWU5]|uniref:DnaJ domain-containing protein n=1 Tax=Dawidia cretensis TaxID=2782350 RepID=A0AAP2DZ51_9BACT|nr:DnaJ domain-containing protein [Dawidia cretensis]MBT1710048.1 DnaJ domain-containing protein [Dawidia cretensis]
MKDYYAILGIRSTAHAAEIKRIYRRLVVQYHPDKNPDPQAHAYMAEINEAYDVLGDPDSRAAYDLRRQQGWTELVGGATAAEQAPPAPRHRDPKYRPRPAPTMSARRQREELIKQCVPYIRWFNYVGLMVTVLFMLDYMLPYSVVESEVDAYYFQRPGGRGRNLSAVLHLSLINGDHLKVYDYDGPRPAQAQVQYSRTLVYRTAMSLYYQGTEFKMGYVYRALAMFPGVLFVISLSAVLFRHNLEFFFNASFVNAVLLLITLWLIL